MSDYQGPPGFTSTFAEYTDQAPQQEVRSPSGYTRETELDRAQAVIRGERTSVKQAPQGFQNDLDDFSISLERALQYSDNPQRDRYKAYASVQLADEMGLDPYFVMHNFDSVTEQRYGMSVLPEKAWTLIENDFKRGVGALSIGHLGAALMLDPDNENLFGQLQDAMAGMPDLTDQDRTFLNKAAGGIANMGPSMGATLAAGFAGAKAGGLFGAKGAAIGAVVGIAGESSTIAAGNIFADIAFMEDPRNGKPMIQSVFESAQNQKIDPETGQLVPDMEKEEVAKQFLRISRAFALGGGVASGLLDVPQMDLLTGGRVLNEIVEKNISQIATDALKDSVLKNMAAQFVITHGVNVSAEILQEELQESAEWWATEWGKRNVAEQLKIAGVPQGTIDEYLRHVKGTFEQVGPAMLFLGAPGSIRMAGMQAVVDKRSAVQGADLSWSATMDDAFANVTDIARTGEVSREAVQAAEARIDPAGKQAPIRVVEDQSGAFEVDPADEARLEAYEARGIENVPVKVTPWQATLEENMTPERLAAMNEWSIENGTIVVPSRNVIEKLAEQDPEQFQVSESGDLTFTGMDLQYTSPIMSQSEYVFEQSGMKETIAQIENRLDELEADDRQDAEEFIQATKEAARDDNYVEAYQNLRDDPLLEKFNVWFADMGMDAGYDRLVDAAIEAEQALLPAPQEVEVLAPRKDVIPMNEAAPAREEFQRVSDELASLDRIIKTPEVQAKIEELQARKAELEPFMEDAPEGSARRAVEGHWPIPDKTLEAYSDRPWAAEELAHRKVLRATKNLYDDIATCETVADAEAYLTTDWYWETEPPGAKEAFFEALPDDPEVREHFFEEMMDRARYKPERNMEDFLMATETDEGLSAWLGKISRFDLYGAGFSKEMNQAISLIDRGKEVSEGMLRRVRATINKNPDKWQGVFYRAAALRDPDLSYHLQTQLDYEYIMSLEGERANYGPADISPEGDFSYTVSAITQDGVQIGYEISEDRKIFFLGKIVVPEELRGKGFATRSMNRIIDCADRHGYQVQLTPSDAWGSSEAQLTAFYKRFGFVENADENYRPEVANLMYRQPDGGEYFQDINEMSEKQAERTLTATEEKIRALKEALTSARKEAAKAVSEARKEAKAKERAKGKERVDKLRAQLKQQVARRDAIKKGKEQKKRLAQQIMKPAAKGINVRVRDKIEVLQGLLDPGFRSKANVEAWQQEFNTIVAKYKDEGLEALVTKYDMSPRPLNLWTPEQLQQLKEYVDGLRVSGKKYQHDLENSMREERRKVREYIIDRWNDGTPPELPPAGTAEGRKARRTGVAKTGAFWIQRPPRIFRWMEGWAEGPFFDFFVTKVNELTDKVIETTMARHAAGDAKMKELGLTWDGLGEKTTFGNLILSRDEMISVWIYMKNEKAALAVRNGNGLSDDVITMIDNDLTDAEKAWGQYMINDFAEHRGRMEKVYELYMNEHLGKEKAYFPMLRQEESWADHDKPFGDMTDQFGFRNEWKSGYANRDFTKDRVTNKAKRQGAVRLGATHVWYTQIERHEQFVNFGIHTKDMNALVETWQFKDAVQNRFGAQGQEFLRKYIQDVANPTSVKGHDALSLASRYVRKNTAIAYLGFNALTVAKQAPSIALFMRDVGPHRLLAAAGKLMTNWDNFKFIQEHDPQMASRVITKEIELLRQKEKKRGARAVSAIGNVGMKGIQFVDQMVTSIGWMAVYDKYVNTLGHEAAVRKAQMAVLETQPSARAKDLAQLYRSGELASWATMFSNQINNIFGMATFDAAAAFKNREFGRLAGITTGIGVSIFCMTLLAGWRPDDEEDETVKAFARQIANLVPLIGKDISGGIVGWDQGGISFFPVAGEMGNFVQEAAELDPEGIGKALIGVGTGVGVLAGVPVTGAKRVGEAVEARDVRELFGSAYVGD